MSVSSQNIVLLTPYSTLEKANRFEKNKNFAKKLFCPHGYNNLIFGLIFRFFRLEYAPLI
jgi:hypothetical protein